jgi:formate hydrogenlyase subunit 3/multisubunit Na+/H+ antiporter MnhD subunit
MSIAGLSEPPKLMEVVSPMFIVLGLVSAAAGIAMAVSQKRIDRKARAA